MASPPAATTPTNVPNSGPKLVFVPRRAADPLRRPTKRSAPGSRPSHSQPTSTSRSTTQTPAVTITNPPAIADTAFSPDGPSSENKVDSLPGWQKFPLTTTKKQLLKDLRFHVMRLHSKHDVNPNSEDQFTRPIRLHRRDPRAPLQGGKEAGLAVPQADDTNAIIDPEEMVQLEAERAAKEAEHAATLAAIAPYGGAQNQKKNMFKKKTQQVFKQDEAAKKLRYEEYLPWHIEDFDNKNTWVGNLEGALSDGTYAVFILEDAAFRMIPVEKWYKFTQQSHFQTLTIEEAENAMKMKTKPPRWLMQITKAEEKELKAKEEQENQSVARRLLTVKGDRLAHRPKSEVADADEIDYDENFQDDEETPMVEGDEEENKTIEKRLRKEHLSANFFDNRGEKEWEEEEKERQQLELSRKKGGKKVKKYLKSLEKNATYESDSDENPYLSESEEESTDEEEAARRAEEEKKKAAEKVKAEADQKRKETSPPPPDKGKGKDAEKEKPPTTALDKLKSPPKKASATDTKLKASLKKSGADADLSGRESGTETPSGRKKPPTSGTPAQPIQASKGPRKRTRDSVGGTASDTEGAEGSGTENGKIKKHKGKLKSINAEQQLGSASATVSRAVSPAAPPTAAGGSRAASPGTTPGPADTVVGGSNLATTQPNKSSTINITADEIKAVLNTKPEGQTINEFLAHFRGRVAMDSYQEFLALLKPLTKQKGKLICPK